MEGFTADPLAISCSCLDHTGIVAYCQKTRGPFFLVHQHFPYKRRPKKRMDKDPSGSELLKWKRSALYQWISKSYYLRETKCL